MENAHFVKDKIRFLYAHQSIINFLKIDAEKILTNFTIFAF